MYIPTGGSQVFGTRVCCPGAAVGEQRLSVGMGPFRAPQAPQAWSLRRPCRQERPDSFESPMWNTHGMHLTLE